MKKKALMALTVAVLFCSLAISSVLADSRERGLRGGIARPENVYDFNINPYPQQDAARLSEHGDRADTDAAPWENYGETQVRRPLGATSVNVGEGVGESIDLTFNDFQMTFEAGRQVAHWYNGLTGDDAKVSVHFAYVTATDTATSFYTPYNADVNRPTRFYTGYNVYDATLGGDWPQQQDDGCRLQATDTAGFGYTASLAMMYNGLVVIGGEARTAGFNADQSSYRIFDSRIYFQAAEWNCSYNPYEPASGNVSWIDTNMYRDEFLTPPATRDGMCLRDPQVMTQWDGSNTIVHLLAGEDSGGNPTTAPGYGTGNYWVWFYFRKVGDIAQAGNWEYMKVIDTIDWVNMMMAVADYPNQGVACVYANHTAAGIVRGTPDRDVFCRESTDRGVTWQPSYSITNYDNGTEGSTNHGDATFESHCMFDSEGDLHAYFFAIPTSANPYFDGYFNAVDQFTANLYHWEKTAVPSQCDIVKIANGNFMNPDMLTGGINRLVCGFGGSNSNYMSWATMGECDGKLYLAWSQIHERANRYPWQEMVVNTGDAPLDDCSLDGNKGGMANWEILMSVARLETSGLWDYPRNISNTYRPDCGLPGDPEAQTVCASEWKPQMERLALNETGLALTWPQTAIVDMSPGGNYAGGWYLNMQYMDDQYPGPGYWGDANAQGTLFRNPPPTWNSEKWIRLACVEPIEASRIATEPTVIEWPEWVPLGSTEQQLVRVLNEGNVELNITQIGTVGGSWLSTSENPTTGSPWVIPAGCEHIDTFYININATAMSQPTWLDGYVWLKSDAVNSDSITISLHILAATHVEPAVWDTVKTHEWMYEPALNPTGACVGLAVGNAGELGLGGWGTVNLDYIDAAPNMPLANQECDTTVGKTALYLVSSSPYVILATNSSGGGAEMTQVFNDLSQADETGFDPTNVKGSITGGVTAGGEYDSVYTGRFVNRDTSIAMERIVYGPRSATPATDIMNFVIVYTKVYSADGAAHSHMTLGNAADWDLPADVYNHNMGGVHTGGNFVYVQGHDTLGHDWDCSHDGRYATEAFGGGYTSAELVANACANSTTHNSNGVYQAIMVDTSAMRDGTPLVPSQPNPLLWWQTAGVSGLHIDQVPDTGMDLCTFVTYKYDYSLGATDTLHYWTVMTTTPVGGTLTQLASQVSYARNWYTSTVRGCDVGCCVGRVGDANGSHEAEPDEVTLGDIMLMVDVKFISGDCTKLACVEEADVNQDGLSSPTCEDHVTLGDIMVLVDHLFISNAPLKACL